jgi:hypothetical protein
MALLLVPANRCARTFAFTTLRVDGGEGATELLYAAG